MIEEAHMLCGDIYMTAIGASPIFIFGFDFYIEADINVSATETLMDGSGLDESARRRADEVFPVQYETVWINSDLGRSGNG